MVSMTNPSTALQPGTYTKGDQTRVADTVADATAAVWDGFVRVEDEAPAESPSESDTPLSVFTV